MPDWFAHLRTRAVKPQNAPSVGMGRRVYAVGDVHGCLEQLRTLKALIAADNARRASATVTLIYVGDYIDRGPDSRGVLDDVRAPMLGIGTIVQLKGNHELMMQQFLRDPVRARDWLSNGGLETLSSFGIDGAMAERGLDLEATSVALAAALGPDRAYWLHNLALSVQIGDYFFCHAGVRPGIALADQREVDLLWMREPFLNSKKDFGAVVVHGHTPGTEPEVRANRINLDTACFATGRLTAAVLDGDAAVTFLASAGTVKAKG
jgi:serine/threonine protein phosphatase 1